MEINYISYLKNIFSDYLDAELLSATTQLTSTQADGGVSWDIHDEFSHNESKDVDITVQKLTGNITTGLIQIPYQLVITCREDYVDLVRRVFDTMAYDLSSKMAVISNVKVKQIINTSVIMQNHVDYGEFYRSVLVVSINLFAFDNYLDIETVELSLNGTSYSSLDVVGFGVGYVAETDATGSVYSNNGLTKDVVRTAVSTISMTIVSKNDNVCPVLIRRMITRENINANYTLRLTMSNDVVTQGVHSAQYTISYKLVGGTFTKEYNNFAGIELQFRVGDE